MAHQGPGHELLMQADTTRQLPRILVANPWILPAEAAYSLGELLPIVELDPAHAGVRLDGVIRYYFMFHRMLGYVLGLFVAAGLSGLTQKS
jgi:hypothetical protein